jgi:xylulokinase
VGKILAIDLGTTLLKFTLFERSGSLCDVCRIPSPVVAAEAGRMDLPADAFADVIAQGIAELRQRADVGLADVEAVTFATQTNSFVLLDAAGRPLGPIILWPDRRAADLETEARRRCDVPGFSATTGIPQMSLQFMAAKLLWLQRQSPATWEQTDRLCLISDYFTLLLTGQHVTEAGAAGLTGLVDIHRCRWWPEMLARFSIDERWLPSIVRAGSDLGPIDPAAAKRLGLPVACRFVVGCLDQYAGAIGAGNIESGMLSETTGTALATVRCADRFVAEPRSAVFQGPAFSQGLYWQMTFGDVSANYLQWYRDQLPDRPDFEQLTALAESISLGAEGLRLNAAVGLTDPQDVFENMSSQHTRGHAVRCILEAVALALCEQIAALSDDAMPQEIRCAGGAARSDLWLQIKADVLGAPTVATTCPEPTSLGAAMLAEAAISGAGIRQIAQQWVRLKPPHYPDSRRHEQYLSLRRNRTTST